MLRNLNLHIDFAVSAEALLSNRRVDLAELKRSLSVIAGAQSIAQAALELGVTYRTLWGRLQTYDDAFSAQLVGKSRGRGTHLTGKGRAILAALERHAELFAVPAIDRIREFAQDLAHAMGELPLLRLLASHDFAIAQAFAHHDRAGAGPAILDFTTLIHSASAGSDHCIRALVRGDADLAGYHHRTDPKNEPASAQWRVVEQSDEFWSLPLMTREQGLIVAPARKGHIQSLSDLTQATVRLVNRQRGSGTRALLDALLAEARVSAAKISGYEHEEFTHQAVAATIAAGAADVGLGLRAAAAQFNLHFIPLTSETYRLAGRSETRSSPAVAQLVSSIKDAAEKLPGYKPIR